MFEVIQVLAFKIGSRKNCQLMNFLLLKMYLNKIELFLMFVNQLNGKLELQILIIWLILNFQIYFKTYQNWTNKKSMWLIVKVDIGLELLTVIWKVKDMMWKHSHSQFKKSIILNHFKSLYLNDRSMIFLIVWKDKFFI